MTKKIKTYIYIALILVTAVFIIFGEQCGIGYFMGGDTEAYYLDFHHQIEVSPGYPLFIHLINLIFGDALYLNIVVAIQIVLILFSIFYLVYTIDSIHDLKWYETVIVWGFSLAPFVILLPEDPLGHTIMTESLTYPLLYIFIALIYRGVVTNKYSQFYIATAIAALMHWIRPQMEFAYVAGICAAIYVFIREIILKKTEKKTILINTVIYIATVFIVIFLVGKAMVVYEKVCFNAPFQSYSDQILVQRQLYLSDWEDRELFDDPDMRGIFEEMSKRMDEKGSNYKYFDDDWKSWSEIFAAFGTNSYTLTDVSKEYFEEKGLYPMGDFEEETRILNISHELTRVLLKEHWEDHIRLTFQLLPKSLISTVLFHKKNLYSIIWPFTVLVYLLGLIGSILVFVKFPIRRKAAELMLLVMGTSIVNALACDIIHCGIQRYMTYTLGLTWVSLFILARTIISEWRYGKINGNQ